MGANHHRKRIWILAYSHSNSNFWSQSKSHATSNSMERKLRKKNSNTGELSRTSNVVGENALCGHEKSNLLAYTNCTQFERNQCTNGIHKEYTIFDSDNTHENVGDTEISRLSSCFIGQGQGQSWRASIGSAQWWKIEPPLDRVANGVDARVDRLKALGNGQVSEVARRAWEILSDQR